MLRTWREDVRSVARGLFRSRAFAIAAVLTLAAGAAASILVFTLVRSVLLRPLPVRDQHGLIVAWRDLPASGYAHHPFGDRAIARAAADTGHFAAVAGVDANGVGRVVLVDNGAGAAVNSALVTGAFFEVLGVVPVIGRTITPADDVDGAEPVVVIGYALWRSRFAASPAVLGRRVTLGERRYTIVGVMPADLDYPIGVDVWAPTHTVPTDGPFGDAARREIDLVARLRPGTTMAEASAALQALLRHDDFDGGLRGSIANVRLFEDAIVGTARRALLALLAAVALVLFVACANVANLQLMRMEGRRGELAVHAALGAGRARLVRQVALEMLMLGAAATALGALAAWWGARGLVAALPAGLPRVGAIGMDAGVAAFAAGLPLLMTAIASLPAALLVGRQSIAGTLSSAGRGAPPPARGRRLLVVVQVALAVAIVASAGVLVRGLARLRALDTGLAEDRLLFAELSLTGAAADRARHGQVLDAIVARVRSLPGVVAATPVNAWPYAEAGWDVPAFTAEGQDTGSAAANPALNLEAIGPHHFDTLQVAIVRGRAFTPGRSRRRARRRHRERGCRGPDLAGCQPDRAAREVWRTRLRRRVVDDRRYRCPDALPRAGRGAADDLSACRAVPRYRRAAGDSYVGAAGDGGAGDPWPRRSDRSRRPAAARRDVRRDRVRAFGPAALSRDPVGRVRGHGGAAGGDRPLCGARRDRASPRSRDRHPHRRRRHAVDDPPAGGRGGHDARRNRRRCRRRRCRSPPRGSWASRCLAPPSTIRLRLPRPWGRSW